MLLSKHINFLPLIIFNEVRSIYFDFVKKSLGFQNIYLKAQHILKN